MKAGTLSLEKGFSPGAAEALSAKGHEIQDGEEVFFGGAQGIVINRERGVLEGGSDPRMDGCAIGW
jgi:gamma-glutamyltranspeptidase/glutathione hydrolase